MISKTKSAAPAKETALSETAQQQADIKAISSRSTSTESQHARLLALLRTGPQTTYSLRQHGIAQCAARIFQLRAEGHLIATENVKAVDSAGYTHVRVARYTLLKEAQKQQELPEVANG